MNHPGEILENKLVLVGAGVGVGVVVVVQLVIVGVVESQGQASSAKCRVLILPPKGGAQPDPDRVTSVCLLCKIAITRITHGAGVERGLGAARQRMVA